MTSAARSTSRVPTAPPWWAAEQGYIEPPIEHVSTEVAAEEAPHVRRIMVDAGEQVWRQAWQPLYDSFNSNPWAAMPSLHFATSLMAALHLSEVGKLAGAAGWGYAGTLGFALVYLGEHYVTDLIAGAALVAPDPQRRAARRARWSRRVNRRAAPPGGDRRLTANESTFAPARIRRDAPSESRTAGVRGRSAMRPCR